jgi:hypothetical protein
MLLLVLGPALASAATLAFVEGGVGDESPVVVHADGFDCGVVYDVNGELAHVEGCWLSGPIGYAGVADAYMVEPPEDPDHGAISDRVHVVFNVDAAGQGHIIVDFYSAPTGAPIEYPPPGIPVLVEDGSDQLLNPYFVDAAGQLVQLPLNLQIFGNSDVGSATPTRPTTWGQLKTIYR